MLWGILEFGLSNCTEHYLFEIYMTGTFYWFLKIGRFLSTLQFFFFDRCGRRSVTRKNGHRNRNWPQTHLKILDAILPCFLFRYSLDNSTLWSSQLLLITSKDYLMNCTVNFWTDFRQTEVCAFWYLKISSQSVTCNRGARNLEALLNNRGSLWTR